MNCHQILSGACNAGDRCFAVGSVEGVSFTVRFFIGKKYDKFFIVISPYLHLEKISRPVNCVKLVLKYVFKYSF